MHKCITEARAGIFPIPIVGDVIDIEAQSRMALFPADRVARTEAEEVIPVDALGVVARCLLASGLAPAGKNVQAPHAEQIHIGEQSRAHVGHIDHLLIIVGRRAGIAGGRVNGRD